MIMRAGIQFIQDYWRLMAGKPLVLPNSDLFDDGESDAERIAAEAYQVIANLANHAGCVEHPEVIRALDYFGDIGNCRTSPKEEILPWPRWF